MSPLRLRTAAYCAAATLLTLPATVFAAGDADPYGEQTALDLPEETTARTADVASGGGGLARTFVGLAVVVGVIYGLTWVMRQVKSSREERSTGFGLSSEAVVPLGPNRSVHLIRAGRELVLVGSAEQGVVPIRTYSEDEARSLGLIAGDDDEQETALAPRAAKRTLLELLKERTVR